MKRIYIAAVIVCALLWAGCGSVFQPTTSNRVATVQPSEQNGGAAGDDSQIGRAFKNRTSNVQVEGEGVVTRILSDDLDGSRHQRFIVRLASGQTVLIAHNIDIAPRVAGLQEGDRVRFYGEYVWNEKGGMVHWTHHDPAGRHVAGWLKSKGRTYQ
jgi:ABC-type glycerol-3-phosphate transport system substrate-binding protein